MSIEHLKSQTMSLTTPCITGPSDLPLMKDLKTDRCETGLLTFPISIIETNGNNRHLSYP